MLPEQSVNFDKLKDYKFKGRYQVPGMDFVVYDLDYMNVDGLCNIESLAEGKINVDRITVERKYLESPGDVHTFYTAVFDSQ